MTKREAIDVLKANYPAPCFGVLREAVDLAIESLRGDVPDTNVGDIISRQAALDCFHGWLDMYGDFNEPETMPEYRAIEALPSAQPEPQWIPCSERLPEREQEVLICTEKKLVGQDAYIDSIVTPALYEDGTMLENDSKWHWVDMDYAGWDEEEDCGIIPEGWWENRHFYPDGDYNNVVDRKVIAWMPLPEPYKEVKQ